MEKIKRWFPAYIRAVRQIGYFNASLLIFALLGSGYVLFLQESPYVNLYWLLALPFVCLPIDWKKPGPQVTYVAGTMGVLLFLCLVKLNVHSKEILLSGTLPQITAALISYPVTGLIVWYFTKKLPSSQSTWSWRLSLTVLMGTLAVFYVLTVLKTVNCLFAPKQHRVYCKTTVCQKCPPYNGFALCLNYTYEGKKGSMLLEVPDSVYLRVNEGDTLTLLMHPGFFGWPWYHPGIGFRTTR